MKVYMPLNKETKTVLVINKCRPLNNINLFLTNDIMVVLFLAEYVNENGNY